MNIEIIMMNCLLKKSEPKIKYNIGACDIIENILKKKQKITINLKDAIFDLPLISSNPKPNNYDVKNEIEFGNKKYFGENVSKLKYEVLINHQKCTKYRNQINRLKNKGIIHPETLYNHKSRYHNPNDLSIYNSLKQGKYLNHPSNIAALKKINKGTPFTGFLDKYFKLNQNHIYLIFFLILLIDILSLIQINV